MIQIGALSSSAPPPRRCLSPCFPSHKMAPLMTHPTVVSTQTSELSSSLPFSLTTSIQSSAKSYWFFLQFFSTNWSLFPIPIDLLPSSLTRLLLKPLNWLPCLHSCSAEVHSHTSAKVIFICLKAMLLSYLKHLNGFPLPLYPNHTSHSGSYIPPWYRSCPTPYTCLIPSPPYSLDFLCLELGKLTTSSNPLHFYSVYWNILFPGSLHIPLTHSLPILPSSALISSP